MCGGCLRVPLFQTPCPAGRFGNRSRETSPGCTAACDDGFFCPAGSSNQGDHPCPLGYYCANGTVTPCPPGFRGTQLASTSPQDCTPCTAGTFAAEAGATTCVPCPSPSWSAAGDQACWPVLLTAVVADPPPTEAGFSRGDEITVTFSQPTNAPPVATTEQVLGVVNFSVPLPAALSARWSADGISLTITVGAVAGGQPPGVPPYEIGFLRARAAADSPVRDSAGLSSAAVPGPWVTAVGSWGRPDPPAILRAVALNTGRQVGLGSGDEVVLEFDQAVGGGPSSAQLATPVRVGLRAGCATRAVAQVTTVRCDRWALRSL